MSRIKEPLLAIFGVFFLLCAQAAAEQTTDGISIEPQPLPGALRAFSRQTGLQLAYVATLADGKMSPGTQDETQADAALLDVLDGTDLKHQYVNEVTIAIGPDRAASRLVVSSSGGSAWREPLLLAQAQSEVVAEQEVAEDTVPEEDDEPIELAPQTVTGSRLVGGDPSARVLSFSAEDIAVRGVSTVEEFFRKLPWAFASITTQTSGGVGLPGADGEDINLRGLGLGVASVNLRGMGSANTLVLLNGRRVAGTGGQEEDFVNLLNLPLSAIERVDIQLDGASAVYGSDAIGGVVNFITKKDYRGFSATYRSEFSSTEADKSNASVRGGYAWGSGRIDAVVSRSTSDPIINEKTGWTSLDLRPLLGPEFDLRSPLMGQPGVVCFLEKRAFFPGLPPFYSCDFRNPQRYQLPADHSGLGATVDDFIAFNTFFGESAPQPYDELAPYNGVDSATTSLNVNLEQYLTDDLRFYAEVLYSLNESYQEYERRVLDPFIVPASNAYNPFGRAVLVQYAPIHESETGLMPAQFTEAESETRTINLGLIWAFGDGHELQLDINRTKSWREAYRLEVQPRRSVLDPTAEAFYTALASSDPNRAINVFGNGTAQGTAFEEFLTQSDGPEHGVNETRQYQLNLRGQLFDLWGGPVTYAVGGEYRENIIYFDTEAYTIIEGLDGSVEPLLGSQVDVGVARPSRDIEAYYAEIALPFFGRDNARPGLHSLILTLQARYDVYESVGSLGGLEEQMVRVRRHYWDPDEGFTFIDGFAPAQQIHPNLNTAETSQVSPRIGIQYQPWGPDLTLRAAWRRSFRAPVWSDQFGAQENRQFFNYQGSDPYDPDGPTEITRADGIPLVFISYSPDLASEFSDNYSLGFDWSPPGVPGFRWSVDWSKVDFTNRIESSRQFLSVGQGAHVLNNPSVAVRNERGDLLQVNDRDINIAEKYSELITTQLEYAFDTPVGAFTPRVGYTRYLEDYKQVAPTTPRISDLGTQNGVDKYKWQGSLSWLWDRFAADLFVYYSPGYVNNQALFCTFFHLRIPETRCTAPFEFLALDVSSLTTADLTLTYRFDNGLRVRAGGTNILDRSAPVAISGFGQPYDPTRWDARGRVLFLELNWEM